MKTPLKSRELELLIICTKTVLWGILQYGESENLSESRISTFNNKTGLQERANVVEPFSPH